MRKIVFSTVSAFALSLLLLTLASCGRKQPAQQPQKNPAPAAQSVKKAVKPVVTDSEEGSLAAKLPGTAEGEAEAPKIEADSSNVVVDPAADATPVAKKGGLPVSKPPEGSLAAKLQPKAGIFWQPAWRFKGAGGPWLAGVEQSQDGSELAFVETTGKDSGPFGSRIVVYGIHQWKALKVFEVDFKINSFVFIPGENALLAATERQAELKQPFALRRINLESEECSQSGPLPERVRALACASKTAAFALLESGDAILSFNPGSLEGAPKKTKCSQGASVLALSPDGKFLGAASSAKLELFRVFGGDAQLDSSEPLPEGLGEPGGLLFLEGASSYVLTPVPEVESNSDAFLVREGVARKLLDGAANLFAWSEKGKALYVESKAKSMVSPLSLPSLTASKPFSPSDTPPRSSGKPSRMLYLEASDALAVLDAQGSFYLMKQNPKDKIWQKLPVFSAKK